MSRESIQYVLCNLLTLKKQNYVTQSGLCTRCGMIRLQKELRHDMFSTWKHFSGNSSYPVPHAMGAFYAFQWKYGNLFDPDTEYGQLRIDLAEHCISYLTNLLEKEKQDVIPQSTESSKPRT